MRSGGRALPELNRLMGVIAGLAGRRRRATGQCGWRPALTRAERFSANLATRGVLPDARRDEFRRLTAGEIHHAAANSRAVARHLEDAFQRCLSRGESLAGLLRRLDIGLFSCDHRWRDIIEGLNRLGPEYDDCRRIALATYLEYLRSRQAELQRIYLEALAKRQEPSGSGMNRHF